MISYNDATDEVIAKKEDIRYVENAAYLTLEAVKPDCSQDDFSFPDGLVDRIIDNAVYRTEMLNEMQRQVCARTMPIYDIYSITSYGAYTFAGYRGEELDITVSSRITYVGKRCFKEATLDSVIFNGRLTHIAMELFSNSTVKSVTFTQAVQSPLITEDSPFENCRQLKTLILPNNLKRISPRFCYYCDNLESISFPNATGVIGDYAFYYCQKLPSVTIPSGVTGIGAHAFDGCTGIHTLSLGSNLETIGTYAFRGCTSIQSVTIPASVTSIDTYAFNGCSALNDIYMMSPTPPTLGGTTAIPYQNTNLKIHIPAGSLEDYQSATYWRTASIKNKLVEMEA